ncbi:MAG TPA: hypothetical protein VFD03_06790 [Clostridia bacterium]|nr:hypothetical protein [Clostridia bacterium]
MNNEKLKKEIIEYFEYKGIDITDEKVNDWCNNAITELQESFHESPCENCDNPYCKTVDRIWFCLDQR